MLNYEINVDDWRSWQKKRKKAKLIMFSRNVGRETNFF